MSSGRTLDIAVTGLPTRRRERALLSRPTAVLVLLATLSTPLLLQPWIASDGIGYYAYFRSLLFDGDLSFDNEFRHYAELFERHGAPTIEGIAKAPHRPITTLNPVISEPERTSTGLVWNPWPVGSAMLWAPFSMTAWAVVEALRAVGYSIPNDGYSAPYEVAVGLGTVVFGIIGLLLCVHLCRRYFSDRASLIAVLATWFGTTFVFYLFVMPSYAHVHSMFTVTWFVLYWHLRFDGAKTPPAASAAFFFGAIGGLMTAVQWTNLTFVATFGALATWNTWASARPHRLLHLLRFGVLMGAGWALAFSPQLVANQIAYGGPFANPQPTGFFDGFRDPHLVGVLLSTDHGLFVWTPLALFGLLGAFFFSPKGARVLVAALGLNFLMHLYVNASAETWSGGGFGQRRFTNQSLLFALGIAALVERLQTRSPTGVGRVLTIALPGAFVAWNLLLILQYVLWIAPHWGEYPLADLVWGQLAALRQLGKVLSFLL